MTPGPYPSDVVRLMLDRRLWRGSAPLCVVLLVAANAYIAHMERGFREERRANLLMMTSTEHGAGTPRYDWSIGEDPGRYWDQIPDAEHQPVVILSGMSQMYAINDMSPGDEIIVEHLDDALAMHGVRAFGLAAPNMNNEEALLYLLATSLDAATRPTSFVYGVCFDKFRNVDLRPGLQRFLHERPSLRGAWAAICASRSHEYPMACAQMRAAVGDTAPGGAPGQADDDAEHRLRSRLGRLVPMIGDSADLNAKAQLNIFLFRNWLFRIKATSKRPMLDSVYQLNQELLGLMAAVAKERSVTLVLYVIPLNPRADNPYVPEQYASFKSWLHAFASDRGLPFANLEGAVPQDDWGLLNGEPDFKHFRERGHQLVADTIVEHFGAILEGAQPPPRTFSSAP